MTEKEYKDGKFRPRRRIFHIYCTACDFLVFICDNIEKCSDKHLNGCIAKIEERYITYYKSILWKRKINRALSSKNEINKLYYNNSYYLNCTFRKDLSGYDKLQAEEIMKEIVVRITNSTIAIQQAWRAFKLEPETWAKQVWNMVRNDGTPDEKKFLGIDLSIKKTPNNYYIANNVDKKKKQLSNRLYLVSYIVAFILLHQQGYRIVEYSGWTCILKWLSNSKYYCMNKYLNNGNVNFVRSSEYALKNNYFKSGYFTIEGKFSIIDFSDLNNNDDEYVR